MAIVNNTVDVLQLNIGKMEITEPTLILDERKCRANINKMVKKASRSGVIFRPHFKTHNSIEIGRWFREEGVTGITVSSMKMARYFSEDGWDDITVAVTVNVLEIGKINNLIRSGVKLNLLIDSAEVTDFLDGKLERRTSVFIKIDTGYNRTGVSFDDISRLDKILNIINSGNQLNFSGFLTHAGHSYGAGSRVEIEDIYKDTEKKLNKLKDNYKKNFPNLKISVGDTPTISVVNDISRIDEIRPGNFVFYDLMQMGLGTCSFDDIAVVLATPVISKNRLRSEIVVYGGAVHLSKERISDPTGETIYGRPVPLKPDGWDIFSEKAFVKSVSQEHSVVKVDENFFNSIEIGDIIGIVPVHSCLTSNLFGSYVTLDGNTIPKNGS